MEQKKSTEKEFINAIITGLFLNRKAGIKKTDTTKKTVQE